MVKVAIIYFTGTGSTAKYASEIAAGIREKNYEVDLFRIEKFSSEKICEYDIIGIGAPVYSYRAPHIVTNFLKKYPNSKKPYFLFCTCGGSPGGTIWSMYNILYKKNWVFLGDVIGRGPLNIRAWRPKFKHPKPENDGFHNEDLLKAKEFGRSLENLYQNIIIDQKQVPHTIKRNFLRSLWFVLLTQRFQMRTIAGKKRLDKEKCNKCGMCANLICPSGCITLGDDNYPRFNEGKCVGCCGCINICPTLAIWAKSSKNKYPFTLYSKYVLNLSKSIKENQDIK